MAVRLQMKLGFVAEPDRLPDSPDAIVVVEPTIGASFASKGSLYLAGHRPDAPAARSARRPGWSPRRSATSTTTTSRPGSVVCLEKAIRAANKKLAPPARPPRRRQGDEANGPIGVGLAVVRGNELYVATVGPAEAYLIRQARLSTLPDPHREPRPADRRPRARASGAARSSVGDSLVLVSPNLIARLGPGRAQGRPGDAPPAVGDGAHPPPVRGRPAAPAATAAIAIEATEVSATQQPADARPGPAAGAARRAPRTARRSRSPTASRTRASCDPGRPPAGPRAAAGGRGSAGLSARSSGPAAPARAARSARHARVDPARDAAPGGDRRAGLRRPGPRPRSSAPRSSASSRARPARSTSITAAERALEAAQGDLAQVYGNGRRPRPERPATGPSSC